ncbi:MAG TPA: 3-hydroxyacyl-ACP dehydratase FabZ family protein [Chitinophaga sp.]|uniref:3-hydroxyacyl-ACP dehydratase FabZ family protein n=1 Tax=Chitinophaga sp. TaxID=1869181 RepID=UPI002C91D34F|nr:3-hydroxyacyl-ACP dehydratase FabZ family protein [Chitinophaga sp.]HVI44015.1 3-hydroxyacyl-ACP dehydratase FabZ family protein [Chitinophaga sp.]
MMTATAILERLPYSHPFLFVDGLDHVDADKVTGHFTFRKDMEVYNGHFRDYPVTPGVLLTETMAQIGVVCLGIYLMGDDMPHHAFALTSTEVEFLLPVLPGEKVTVTGEKIYFRFGKLKCRVMMQNEAGEEVCSGIIAGMIINRKDA